ncbi:hypothetical protein HA402_010577 [Bradysia odoriphaga]|nr:hypothetical protein HA402_010577 [Bradysia odoriphaga]
MKSTIILCLMLVVGVKFAESFYCINDAFCPPNFCCKPKVLFPWKTHCVPFTAFAGLECGGDYLCSCVKPLECVGRFNSLGDVENRCEVTTTTTTSTTPTPTTTTPTTTTTTTTTAPT